MKYIYLDYAATTPVDEMVVAAMQHCLTKEGVFGNPASSHYYGLAAKNLVEMAREKVAHFIKADPSEIIWTSGATEANNLAIKGVAQLYQRKGKHIVTMQTEHKSVLDACQYLEKEGYQVTYLVPNKDGLLDMDEFRSVLTDKTILVSIMQVNNETGVLQDIKTIAEITAERGILLHVDAVQAAGKNNIDVSKYPIDLLSLSAHKVYGPKGVGTLYLRKKPRVRVAPLIHGGGHEQGMRSGTLATHQIVGMGEALILASQNMEQETINMTKLRDNFIAQLSQIANFKLNTNLAHCVPHILNVRFEDMLTEALLAQLPMLAASTGSACLGKGGEGSYVLRAMGLTTEQAKSSIRFSFGRFTTQQEIEMAAKVILNLFI